MPKRPRNIVGPQVRQARFQRGLSQPALAAKCQLLGWDIGRDTIAKIEGQTRWVGDAELVHLSRSLAIPLDALFPAALRRSLRRA
jgi:transcriptional regulator with XRE-family HTH domain